MHCNRLTAMLAVLVICLCPDPGTAAEQTTLEVGPWSARLGPADLESLSWRGDPIVLLGGVRGYQPHWEGARFTPADAQLTLTDDTATWVARDPGNQDATLRLTLTPRRARYELDTTVHAPGPTEFWLQLAPEALAGPEQFFFWTNERSLHTLPLGQTFDRIDSLDALRFMQRDRTVTIRCNGFELQDRRERGSGLFLVDVIGSRADGPTEAQRWIEIEVEPADEDALASRTALLSQVATETLELPLSNPGFEADEPLSAWTFNPLAHPDADIAHSGQVAARLDVDHQILEGESVYLIQTAPVQEGHLYSAQAWIQGEDVRPETQRGMKPAGATVIIEFADKDGNWLAAGDYADPHYGTFDWTRAQTDAAQAPDGAGRAIIYLALRGIGTAWFDDVRLEEVRHNVVLLEPHAQARVHDNTPTLHWHFERDGLARVELSRDATFSDGATRVIPDVMGSEITLSEPIEPGTWNWRVRMPEYDAQSRVWSFGQTAALDEDTTEPRIAREHDWLAAPQAPMRVSYSDNVGVATIRLTVDGRDVSDTVEIGPDRALYTPPQAWQPGLHRAEVEVEDAARNSARRTLFFTHGEPPDRITWREHGGVTIGDERRFLLGMYGVNIEHMPEIAAAGFDYCHSYRWDGSGTTQEALEYLDAAQRHGLRVFMGLDRRRLLDHDEDFVAERVGALMTHPALLAWYLFDEPDLEHQYVPPPWLERYYRLIRSLDPFHPVVVTCATDGAVPRYRDALDVHWTQVYGDTKKVATRLDLHRGALREHTPLAAILHCYDRVKTARLRGGESPADEPFDPDGRMMRANAFMAIAHRSSGLTWWWWGYGGGDRFVTVANAPEAWASLQETVARIHELEPVLVADGEVTTAVLSPAEGVEVHVWEKRLADRVVTIAVNRDDRACEARWQPRWPPDDGVARVLWEEREIKPAGAQLHDSFGPREVHVYEW